MEYVSIAPAHDAAMEQIVKNALKAHGLDIPGTAYFDASLKSLSAYYDRPGRCYYVLLDGDEVLGGIGIAEFQGLSDCCELQKLYLCESARGRGLGYDMIRFIEQKARETGYQRIYLETHTNLAAAIHEYERCGYQRIDPPETVVHTTMNRFYRKEL
jgi:putative acetyltransferase